MNPEDNDDESSSPEKGEQESTAGSSRNSIAETIVMILIGISVIFGVLVLLVLGTCFLG